jgi:carboxypeptidase C (cathepsin A)
MTKNPYMKVLVAAGYYDLATPFYAVEYTFNHMGLNPEMHKRISWAYYQAGHMLYIDSDSHAKMKHDIGEFLSSALPKGDVR